MSENTRVMSEEVMKIKDKLLQMLKADECRHDVWVDSVKLRPLGSGFPPEYQSTLAEIVVISRIKIDGKEYFFSAGGWVDFDLEEIK